MRIFRVGNFRVKILHGGQLSTWGFFPVGIFRVRIYVGGGITVRAFRAGIVPIYYLLMKLSTTYC